MISLLLSEKKLNEPEKKIVLKNALFLRYVVSGATTFVDERAININKVSNETLRFFWQSGENQFLNCENCSGAIVYAKADKAFINFRFIDTNGNDIYSFNIFPRLPYVPSDPFTAGAQSNVIIGLSIKFTATALFHLLFTFLK